MKLDRHVVIADLFDVVAQSDLSSLDRVAQLLQPFHYVERGHRPVKNPVFADAAVETQNKPVELFRFALRAHSLALFALGQHAPLFFDHSFVACRSFYRQSLRQQVVSAIT